MSNSRPLERLSLIADQFDAVLLDQWGVLTDGAKAPPGAIDAVAQLRRAGKRLAVLSNSARLGSDSYERLARLGYDPDAFAGIVTSGETAQRLLLDRTDPYFADLGYNVLVIAREPTLIEGTPYRAVEWPEEADFVLLGSSTAPELSLARDHAPLLERAAARGLKLVCANPDRTGIAAEGFTEAPGALADYYESLGGTARYIGKPNPEVYARAMTLLGNPEPGRTLAIGDSLEHDIAGGARAGCRTALIAGGIHAEEMAEPGGLQRLCDRYRATPDDWMPLLLW